VCGAITVAVDITKMISDREYLTVCPLHFITYKYYHSVLPPCTQWWYLYLIQVDRGIPLSGGLRHTSIHNQRTQAAASVDQLVAHLLTSLLFTVQNYIYELSCRRKKWDSDTDRGPRRDWCPHKRGALKKMETFQYKTWIQRFIWLLVKINAVMNTDDFILTISQDITE